VSSWSVYTANTSVLFAFSGVNPAVMPAVVVEPFPCTATAPIGSALLKPEDHAVKPTWNEPVTVLVNVKSAATASAADAIL
jgi:hypothetical protein